MVLLLPLYCNVKSTDQYYTTQHITNYIIRMAMRPDQEANCAN